MNLIENLTCKRQRISKPIKIEAPIPKKSCQEGKICLPDLQSDKSLSNSLKKFRYLQFKMGESEMSCDFCNKVYIRKSALQKHIAAKHQVEQGEQDDGQLFQRLDIPEDFEDLDFPGGDETLIEAAENVDLIEASRSIEDQGNCNNCADSLTKERRMLLKLKSLESSKRFLHKKVKDKINELDNTRLLLEQSVKENLVIKNKLETKNA